MTAGGGSLAVPHPIWHLYLEGMAAGGDRLLNRGTVPNKPIALKGMTAGGDRLLNRGIVPNKAFSL